MSSDPTPHPLLAGKRILVTGVADEHSIATLVARQAASLGAQVVVSAFPRDLDGARHVGGAIDGVVGVEPADMTSRDDLHRLERAIVERWGALDGAVHAVAFAPRAALASVLDAGPSEVEVAFRTSVWSYAALARVVAACAPPEGGALVGLDFDSSRAWPVYNWMGPCKAALRSLNGYLARDLGPAGIRANLVAAGPLATRAAGGIPEFDRLIESWERQAPMAWDPTDAGAVAGAVCFLLSDMAAMITGEVVHVDGGAHAMATWLRPPTPAL